jgi:hypothetical protein
MPNKVTADWFATLNSMRSLWVSGMTTEIETTFVEQLQKPSLPRGDLLEK